MNQEKEIIVIGHKNPDTDSICSAIAYSRLKNQLGQGRYVPRRAGDLSQETAFVLEHFGLPEPAYLADVRSQVCDMELKRTPPVSKEMSIRDAYMAMKENDTTTLAITDSENHVTGLITMTDIAASDMDVYDNHLVSKAKTPFRNIAQTLEAQVLCGDVDKIFDSGRVTIGANTPERMVNYISGGDLVVLGDRFESQFFAIEIGASCIVLCTNTVPNDTILSLAKARDCLILSSPYDSYTVARLINQSMPIGYFMTEGNLLTFEMEDFTDEVKDVMSKVRHRYFPVTDSQGHYLGMISKRSFLALEKKKVVLVDHNEKNQAVDGIQHAEILEIIDHHRLGGMESVNPLLFRNQPLGCTATIITLMAKEAGLELDPTTAGLLCSAILSDTLMFRSPTCTPKDKAIAEELAEIAQLDLEAYAQEMFEAGSDLSSKSVDEIFYQDYKTFNTAGRSFGIGQVNSVSRSSLQQLAPKVQAFMEEKVAQNPETLLFLMLTDILSESSLLLYAGEGAKELLATTYNQEIDPEGIWVQGLVSRKKQLLPSLISAIQQE